MSPDRVTTYTVNGPQSALPCPRVNEVTSRSAGSLAMNELDFFSVKNDTVCCGSSVSTETSYSL